MGLKWTYIRREMPLGEYFEDATDLDYNLTDKLLYRHGVTAVHNLFDTSIEFPEGTVNFSYNSHHGPVIDAEFSLNEEQVESFLNRLNTYPETTTHVKRESNGMSYDVDLKPKTRNVRKVFGMLKDGTEVGPLILDPDTDHAHTVAQAVNHFDAKYGKEKMGSYVNIRDETMLDGVSLSVLFPEDMQNANLTADGYAFHAPEGSTRAYIDRIKRNEQTGLRIWRDAARNLGFRQPAGHLTPDKGSCFYAVCVPPRELTADEFAPVIRSFLEDPDNALEINPSKQPLVTAYATIRKSNGNYKANITVLSGKKMSLFKPPVTDTSYAANKFHQLVRYLGIDLPITESTIDFGEYVRNPGFVKFKENSRKVWRASVKDLDKAARNTGYYGFVVPGYYGIVVPVAYIGSLIEPKLDAGADVIDRFINSMYKRMEQRKTRRKLLENTEKEAFERIVTERLTDVERFPQNIDRKSSCFLAITPECLADFEEQAKREALQKVAIQSQAGPDNPTQKRD